MSIILTDSFPKGKSHFKVQRRVTTPLPPKPPATVAVGPPPPEGESVYDRILPSSIGWHPSMGYPMPLIQHLKDGFDHNKPSAWHRNEERRARGLFPVHNPATQLEGWERELVWMEILILTGNPGSSFRHLARGWGRDKGFHMVLAQFICERRGNVERKKRVKGDEGEGLRHEDPIGADIWDDACYGDAAYNEALAADLLTFSSPADYAAAERRMAEGMAEANRSFSFDDGDGEQDSYDSSMMSSGDEGYHEDNHHGQHQHYSGTAV